jgi:fatty acid desaturase
VIGERRAGALPAALDLRESEIRALRARLRAEGRTRASGLRSLAHGAVLVLAATPTALLAWSLGTWWSWALHWLVASLVCCTLPAVTHEGTHRNLARSRIVNDGAAAIAAALHFIPFETWRHFHLAHHQYAGTDLDSEVYPVRWSRWSLITFPRTQWLFLSILWRWNLATLRGEGPRWIRNPRQVRAVRLSTVVTLLTLAALLAAVVADVRVAGIVLVPAVISLMLSSFTLVPEHYGAYGVPPAAADQLDRTVSLRSNWLLRFVMWNSNYHAAHHFAPRVPAHHLGRVDQLISGYQGEDWRWCGYGAWYAAHLRSLPWRHESRLPLPEGGP